MKKCILFLGMIICFIECKSQQMFLKPIRQDIKGNIILVGVNHEKSTGKKIDSASALMSDESKAIFCFVYSDLLRAAKDKKVVFLMEGIDVSVKPITLSKVVQALKLPDCLKSSSSLLIGCDIRNHSEEERSLSSNSGYVLDSLCKDGIDGKEKTFKEAFDKESTLDFSKLSQSKLNTFYRGCKVISDDNPKFERTIIEKARDFERQGYFVIVLCGAGHAIKIIVEQNKNDIGYVICQSSLKDFRYSLKFAKNLSIREQIGKKVQIKP